mgnify:CR=1 FL=1
MNWPFIVRCLMFGVLWAIWQAASSVYVLDAWPTAFTWLKIGSAAAVAFVGGCLTYARGPEAAHHRHELPESAAAVFVHSPHLLSMTENGKNVGQARRPARAGDLSFRCIPVPSFFHIVECGAPAPEDNVSLPAFHRQDTILSAP